MKLVYDFYSDAGHGWVKVEIAELVSLGIHLAISGFSYMRGKYAYLEEDCDFAKFFEAKKKVTSKSLRMHYHNTNNSSRIRNYDSYNIYKHIPKPSTFEDIRRSALLWWHSIDNYSKREAIKATKEYRHLKLEERTIISSIAIHRIYKHHFNI